MCASETHQLKCFTDVVKNNLRALSLETAHRWKWIDQIGKKKKKESYESCRAFKAQRIEHYWNDNFKNKA